MACLGTSGRQGLFVAVGTRCYRNQKFLCQLFLQNNSNSNKISNRQSVVGDGDGAFTDDGAITISKLLLNGNNTSASALSYGSTSTRYPVQKRHFHLLTNTTVPVAAACSANKDYSIMMNNSAISSNNKSNSSNHNNNYSKLNINNKRKCCSSTKTNSRHYSSAHTQQPAGPVREIQIDPYIILDEDLKYVYDDIRERLLNGTTQSELNEIASYYFDGHGKAFRPMVVFLMAKAINYHLNKESSALLRKQRHLALFAEMAHSASLVHDDVIDQSDYRRGKPSVNALWNHKKVTMAGDFILSSASIMIARLRNDEVTILCSKILTDLVQGEFMQLGSRETENERFAHYLTKTYRKTASLVANTLKATAVIAEADEHLTELAFQYGRNIGLAFQLVDDMLDFVSSTEMMGKPAAADLKLGLATAPVLFACEKYPELNPMIMRRFSEPGDVERAFELVHKSNGLEQTRFLARKHGIEAIRLAQEITESPYQKGLQVVADLVINRMK